MLEVAALTTLMFKVVPHAVVPLLKQADAGEALSVFQAVAVACWFAMELHQWQDKYRVTYVNVVVGKLLGFA